MVIIMGGSCLGLPGGCGGGGCGRDIVRISLPTLAGPAWLKRRGRGKYSRGRGILGGMRVITPFKLVRRGMRGGAGFAKAIKALARALRFKR